MREETSELLFWENPGVRMGGIGLGLVLFGMMWAVFRSPETMVGGAEVFTAVGGLLVLTGIWRGADFLGEESDSEAPEVDQ